VRSGAAVGGPPFVQTSGRGAYAYDERGRGFIDYVMAYGPLLFGHAHPAFTAGLDAIAARGTVFGSTHPEEERLAARVARHLPSIGSLRFVSTGTEAMMSATRAARAFTGRPLVVRFAGNYHGHFDDALTGAGASASDGAAHAAAASGIPPGVRDHAVVARYNDLADLDAVLAGREASLAAILVEPVVANMGLVRPEPGFLAGLFARARSYGALVVFDEVITWLRLGLGGAQGRLGFAPDLTALGKIMGGGFPLAAFGGRADVMAALAPEGQAFTGGTFSGNPFAVALGHRTLDLLEADADLLPRIERRASTLAAGIERLLAGYDLPYAVARLESIVDFKFRRGAAARNFDDARAADRTAFAAYYHEMRARGVLLAPSSNEVMFLSSVHGEPETAATLAAIDGSLGELRRRGLV